MLNKALAIKTVLIKKALSNSSFKAKLLKDPRKAIGDELLLELPAEIGIKVFQDTKNELHVVIPHVDSDLSEEELQDEDLRMIASGGIPEEAVGHALKKGMAKPNGSQKGIVPMDLRLLEEAITALGHHLARNSVHYEVIVIGGASMLLLKQIERKTRDLDIIAIVEDGHLVPADPLPAVLREAAEKVGKDLGLGPEWVCTAPSHLLRKGLPLGFMDRVVTREYKGLTVHLAHRYDQICLKAYASVRFGTVSKHFFDLLALKPTDEELEQAKEWSCTAFKTYITDVLLFVKAIQDNLRKG